LWTKRRGLKKGLKIEFFEKSTRKSSLWSKREGLKNGLKKYNSLKKVHGKVLYGPKEKG